MSRPCSLSPAASSTWWVEMQSVAPYRSFPALIDRRRRRIHGQEGNRLAGRIDRVDLLAKVGRPPDVHAETVIVPDQRRDRLLVVGGAFRQDQLGSRFRICRHPLGGLLVGSE